MLNVKQGPIENHLEGVFGMTRFGIEPRFSQAIGKHANYYSKSYKAILLSIKYFHTGLKLLAVWENVQ